jgi:hypothetical protein
VSDGDIAEKAQGRPLQQLVELALDRLGALMIRRDAEAHQSEGCRQPVEHVDARLGQLLDQALGGVETGRAAADDGDRRRRHAHAPVHARARSSIIASPGAAAKRP